MLMARRWLILLTLLLLAFSLSGCTKRTRTRFANAPAQPNQTSPRININTADDTALETLPGIGKGLAARIIEHREKYGPFRRPEHLIMVRGISERRFRSLQASITVD